MPQSLGNTKIKTIMNTNVLPIDNNAETLPLDSDVNIAEIKMFMPIKIYDNEKIINPSFAKANVLLAGEIKIATAKSAKNKDNTTTKADIPYMNFKLLFIIFESWRWFCSPYLKLIIGATPIE